MTPADLFRSPRTAQDSAVFDRDLVSDRFASLADEMAAVGDIAREQAFRKLAFIAWRAAQSEHNPRESLEKPHWIRCAHCMAYIANDEIDKGPRE